MGIPLAAFDESTFVPHEAPVGLALVSDAGLIVYEALPIHGLLVDHCIVQSVVITYGPRRV